MSRGPPHRYNPTGERSFRGYPPRYGEFSGSSSYGYYGGPPYKRQRRHSSDEDVGPPPVNYGPAFYDPPYVRHQEVGLGEFNDFSSISVEKDLKIHERDGSRKDYERSETRTKKRQSSTEGSGHSSQHQGTSAPSSPHSTKVSPRFSPRHSPRARPASPPSSTAAASQPLLISTSQPSFTSKGPSLLSSDSKQHPLLIVCPTSSQSVPRYGPIVRDKLKDGTGRPASLSSLSPHGSRQRKDSYPGPTVEAISPSAPASEVLVDKDGKGKKSVKGDSSDMMSKDELLQGMEKVDREISQVKQQINNLKKVQKQFEDEAFKQPEEPQKEELPAPEPKPKSVVQMIYEENRKKAEAAQARLAKLGVPLPGGKPLYTQPSDLPCYHENLRRAPAIKAKLVKYFQLRKQAKEIKNRQLCKEYKTLKQAWLKKMERHENNPKRKHKEGKLREFYEKVFPEIKKQREQTERFTRMGSRSNWGIVARSEAEFNEIVDNLNEQEANERHMRTLAVEAPPMLDKEEQRVKFINRNGLIRDPLATLNERKHKNIWTEKERRIFKDKFVHNPKDFDLISTFLPGKTVADCVLFYYQTKKKEHYKQLSRRHNLKKRRRDTFGATRECAPVNKIRAVAPESSAKGERGGSEGEEELEEITDSAEESEENEEHPPPPVTTPQLATPTPPARRPDHVETSRWSEKEIEIALQGLRDCGRDWEAIARRVVTKTGAQCKNFYFNYKKKLHLEDLVAEHERTKMQRAQQQQQQKQQQQPQQQQQQQPPQQVQQKDISSITEKHEPAPKQSSEAQVSESHASLTNQNSAKSNSAATSNTSTAIERESTSVVVGKISNPVGPPANLPTAPTTSSISSPQLEGPRIAPSHSPQLPLTSSSSTLFMPTPGVIASIGRASSNVGSSQPRQSYFRPSLIESMKHDTPHSSRSPHPESIFSGLVYPRTADPSHLRPEFLVSSNPGHPHSDSRPLYQGSSVPKHLPHSTSSQPSSSNSVHSTKGMLQLGSSHAMMSHSGSSHTMTTHSESSHSMTSHPGSSHTMTSHPGSSHTMTSHLGSSHSMMSHPGSSHTMTSHLGSSHSMTSHPGSSHSMTSHPESSHSRTSHLGSSHSMTSHPGSSHTMTSHPGSSHSMTSHPESSHSRTSHLGSSHSMTTHPGSAHSMTTHPGSSHTMTTHPGSSHSMTTHPGSSHSMTTHPGSSHSMTTHPGSSHSMTSHPGSSHSMISHPGSSHTMTSHPGSSQSMTSHPGSTHLVTSHLGSSHSMTSHLGSSHTMTSHPGSSHSVMSHPGSSHSMTSHPGSSHSVMSHQGSSHSMTSHLGISHTGKPHSGDSYGHSSASEPGHAPVSSIVFTPSGPSASAHSHRSRPVSHSPVIVAPQDKPHSQVPFLKEGSAGHHSSHKPAYLSTYPGNMRGEPVGRSIKTDDGRRDISPEMLHKPLVVPEPDVIVIDADDQKKRMEGYPRLETAEGKQASSMLRMLASAGNAPSAEHMVPTTEPVRPQSLPLSSSTRLVSHTESRPQQSATPPCSSSAARQPALNPPPPLIQMSSSRDKKYTGSQDLPQETSRPREGYLHSEPYHERYLHIGQEVTAGRDVPHHSHTPVDNRGGERERQTPVVETVDLTRDREVSTSPLTRPTSRSPVVALSSSSARATLQAMAMYALAETNSADATENIVQNKREETYLPPRPPDPKLSVYEQSEAIRKFTALGNVCVSAPREFPAGGEYPSQPYALMAMQAQHQPHVHPHAAGTSTPPPYGYPFHMGHPMGSFHHHPEHRFLVPVGVHQMLPHTINGEDLPSHLKLSGAYPHQYPQGASYFPAGIRTVVPTYQPVTVCGHRYPVPLSEERRTVSHPLDVPVRRHNDISEQDLANPFFVRQPRHMHTPGMPERASPGELPKFPLPSRSPVEPTNRPRTISPELKPQTAQHAEAVKTVSPPAATYLSRIPSRPASVSEMRNRAAVIPELKDTETVSQTFPEPQPAMVPTSKHSTREDMDRCAEQSNEKDTKEQGKRDKGGSLAEGLPMSAFATLVDVAAAARKVDVPFYAQEKHESPFSIEESTLKKEAIDMKETYGSSHAGIPGHAMTSPTGVTSPPSPSRISPGMSGAPRYGITTGLVPKPPPLMPITGARPMQEGSSSSSSSTSLSVSVGGHGSASISRSPSKLTSPPGTRTRGSVSPDGPPPLISRSVISPTGSSQSTSPKGPPPLIRGIVSPVSPALRSPESEADSTVKTRTNQDALPQRGPDQEPSVSEGAFYKGVSHIDPDFQRTFLMHLHESVPASSQRAEGDDAKSMSSSSRRAGHSQVRTIVETRTYLDSAHAEMRHPSRQHPESFQPSTGARPEQYPQLPSSSSTLVTESREATSMGEVPQSWTPGEHDRNIPGRTHPEQSHLVHGQSGEVDERVQESWQVNKNPYSFEREPEASFSDEQSSSPQHEPAVEAAVSHASGSETEEGDEGELDTEDELPLVHSSSASLHPRVRALARSSQSYLQACYDASDSETLSAEESEVFPESSDEMFPSTTAKLYTQADNVCEGGRDVEHDDILRESSIAADTSVADINAPLPSLSSDYSDNEDDNTARTPKHGEDIEESGALSDTVTSTRPFSLQLPDLISNQPTEDLPTTSSSPEETRQQLERPEVDAEAEGEVEVSVGQEIREETSEASDQELEPSQSSSASEPAAEEDSSEALPASAYEGLEQEDDVRVQSSEDSLVGSSETDIAAAQPQVDSSCQQASEYIPDSSANLQVMPDVSDISSPNENADTHDANATDIVTSITMDDNTTTADQSLMEEEEDSDLDLDTNVDDANVCPSTSGTAEGNLASPVLDQSEEDEGSNEAETLENPPTEHGFLNEPGAYSPSSENHSPEISSAMDDAFDDGDRLSYPTFIGGFVPLPGEADSPDIGSGCSTHIASEASSVSDEHISEREFKDVCEPAPSNQEDPFGVLSPDERTHHTDDTLSEGEIPSSQESSQSEDELASVEDKYVSNEATAVVSNEAMQKLQSTWYPESSQPVTDRDRLPSQSKESVDDEQLSEGEIPESEDEPIVETSQGSPVSFPVSSTVSGGNVDSTLVSSRRASIVSSSQEATLQTDCYINMIPISPAPPESPSHESESDRASPLPQWPSIDSQYSSVMSLSLASRIPAFPYSTLSINVSSANSSARSSPVPHAMAVNLAPGSSPSSSSLLPRPQEPTPLLSDNYEPLSDDDDDGLADTSNISDDQDNI